MLQHLELENFRCFASQAIDFSSPHTIFVGRNAQGKTSVLEAVCVLMRLQSPRPGGRREWTRQSAGHYRIEGQLAGKRLAVAQDQKERRLRVDGEPADSREYRAASSLIVWMGTEDVEIITGPGETRRRYLDFLACQLFPGHTSHLKRYGIALRQRNESLRVPGTPDPALIDALSKPLIEHGVPLLQNRAALVNLLQPVAAESILALSERNETLALTHAPGLDSDFTPGDFEAELKANFDRERRTGQTVIGPHRDDLRITINGRSARLYGSEGQKRGIALALKLAQAKLIHQLTARAPLLLLDDVFGELDPFRRAALIASLPAQTQALLTTTHVDWIGHALPEAEIRQVNAGKIE